MGQICLALKSNICLYSTVGACFNGSRPGVGKPGLRESQKALHLQNAIATGLNAGIYTVHVVFLFCG